MQIRLYQPDDWPMVWPMLKAVFRAGETYPMAMDISEEDAHAHWIEHPWATYVAVSDSSEVLGTYYLKPNSQALGAHVANAGYIVGEQARRQGIARAMAEHSLTTASDMEYRALQFNLVVATNEASVRLWESLEFTLVGRLPGAFKHATLGYVDALVYFKELT